MGSRGYRNGIDNTPSRPSMGLQITRGSLRGGTRRELQNLDYDSLTREIQTIRTVLVVRVNAQDRSTKFNAEQLSNKIFGTYSDRINLKERMESCSYGQLHIEPFQSDANINGKSGSILQAPGVMEIDIEETAMGNDRHVLINAAIEATNAKLGNENDDEPNPFDHLILCLPRGTNENWIAFSYNNHRLSAYNDEWCAYPSAQMHEIGHNLNLAHAGESEIQYSDQTGFMGWSYPIDEGPKMCYSAAKSWQLNWYSRKRKTLENMLEIGTFEATLVGIDDYLSAGDGEYVAIKIESGTEDYYLGFNRQKGINHDTRDAINKVTIQRQGDGYTTSSLEAKLGIGEHFTIIDYMGTGTEVEISVLSLEGNNDKAHIRIHANTCNSHSDCVHHALDCAVGFCELPGNFCSYDTQNCESFRLALHTDRFPKETTWELTDACNDNEVILTGGPYDQKDTRYMIATPLNPSQYTLTIFDQHGDGLCCGHGEGYFSAKMNGVEFAEGESFGRSVSTSVGTCDKSQINVEVEPEWERIFFDGFENGFGDHFFTNGKYATLNTFHPFKGINSLLLRGQGEISQAYSKTYDVDGFVRIKFVFKFKSLGMDQGDGFIVQYAANGGEWINAKHYRRGKEHWKVNNEWYSAAVDISASSIQTIKFQFLGASEERQDKVFIDNILAKGIRSKAKDEVA